MQDLVDGISRRLEKSVERLSEDETGLIFSAGIDSTLIGIIASKHSKIKGYSVGVDSSKDLEYAANSRLPFNVERIDLTIELLAEILPDVLKTVGEPNPLKTSVAIPFHLATRKASKDGYKTMLCGQGADEMFGGYNRYVDTLAKEGYEKLEKDMTRDVDNIHEDQLQYDIRVSRANGIELRFPFLEQELVEYVRDVSIRDKVRIIDGESEYACVDEREGLRIVRKFILRKVAEMHDVPSGIINRSKKAAQYGSGSYRLLEALARRNGCKARAAKSGRGDYVAFYLEELTC